MNDKSRLADSLRKEIAIVMGLRSADLPHDEKTARLAVRAWQARRLARTYRDLLESERYRAAAEFFLGDLYGPKDCSQRDLEVARVVPVLARMLPERALETLIDAVRMDAVSESLDAEMAILLRRMGALDCITDEAYAEAYRSCGRRVDREAQIVFTVEIGRALDQLTHMPLLAASLRVMKKPAELAGLGSLHSFLRRGFEAFRDMDGANQFLARVVGNETEIMRRLYAGEADPFAPIGGQSLAVGGPGSAR